MGLDQSIRVFTAAQAGDVQTDAQLDGTLPRLHTWRKHPNLHGWMEALYRLKGGKEDSFNLASVRLDTADIDALELAVKHNRLPGTAGFFFGQSRPEHQAEDLEFIARARDALARGLVLFYDSWW